MTHPGEIPGSAEAAKETEGGEGPQETLDNYPRARSAKGRLFPLPSPAPITRPPRPLDFTVGSTGENVKLLLSAIKAEYFILQENGLVVCFLFIRIQVY